MDFHLKIGTLKRDFRVLLVVKFDKDAHNPSIIERILVTHFNGSHELDKFCEPMDLENNLIFN